MNDTAKQENYMTREAIEHIENLCDALQEHNRLLLLATSSKLTRRHVAMCNRKTAEIIQDARLYLAAAKSR